MTETSTGELCRLVVAGPGSRVDLSVPVNVPVADLLPALLHGLGPDLADRGLEHSGWVLQRLGEAPLDEDLTLEELGLTDGEALHLRPRSETIPPLDFDDLIDGIATGIGGRSALWRPAWTRFAAVTVAALALVTGVAVLAVGGFGAGEQPELNSLTALAVAVLLLVAGSLAARKAHDRPVAALLTGAAVAFAGLSGLIAGHHLDPGTPRGQGEALLLAAAVAALAGLTAIALVGPRRRGPWAVALLLSAALAALAGGLLGFAGLDVGQTAAVLIVITAAVRPSIPMLAFRMSGLRLPPLPVTPGDLQVGIEPESGVAVLAGAATADDQMTALHTGLGLACAVALIALAGRNGWLGPVTVLVAAAAPLLSLRAMTSGWHRLALGLPALAGVTAVAVSVAVGSPAWVRPALALGLAVVATVVASAAHTLPLRRTTPIWGRAGDVLQTLTLVALLPLAVGVLGGYGLIRGVWWAEMQSRRDQVEAQSYLLSRLTGALVSADPDAPEPPTRRDSRGFVASALVTVLAAGAVVAFALFSARGSTMWQKPGSLIVNRTDGSRYLLVGGELRPVLNLASAKLVAGTALKTVSVKTATLQDVPRGDPIGIPGAPDSLPQPARLNAGVWRVCATTPDTALADYPAVHVVTDIGHPAAAERFGPDDGLLVSTTGPNTYLLWRGEALRLAAPWVADVLGWGDVTPLEVSPSWLSLLTPGPDLAPIAVSGRGTPGPRIDGRTTRIGQLFHPEAAGTGGPDYLLERTGLTALSPVQNLLYSAQHDTGPARLISAAGLAGASVASGPQDSGLPLTAPHPVLADEGLAPCVEYPGRLRTGRPDLVWSGLPAAAHPSLGAGAESAAGADPEQAVAVLPGGGALVAVTPASDSSNPSLLLVDDAGTAYPLSGTDAVKALGYDASTAAALPPRFLTLLPEGALLSPTGAG